MILPSVVPGQHVDEAIGIGITVQSLAGGTTYTVPAGFTLLIHGCCFYAGGATVSSLTIGGVTIYSGTTATGSMLYYTDRRRHATQAGGAGFQGMTQNSYGAAVPGRYDPYVGAATNYVVAENAPFLFWPLAAGQVVQAVSNAYFSFWGSLIPT